MSRVVLSFAESDQHGAITEVYGDLTIPRVGEAVHLGEQQYRVEDVIHDYPVKALDGEQEADYPHVWVIVQAEETPTSGGSLRKVVKTRIRDLQNGEYEDEAGVPRNALFQICADEDVSPDQVQDAIQKLRDMGEIYNPDGERLRVV